MHAARKLLGKTEAQPTRLFFGNVAYNVTEEMLGGIFGLVGESGKLSRIGSEVSPLPYYSSLLPLFATSRSLQYASPF